MTSERNYKSPAITAGQRPHYRKYIYPRDLSRATRWFLNLLRATASLDKEQIKQAYLREYESTLTAELSTYLTRQLYTLTRRGWIAKKGEHGQPVFSITKTGRQRLESLHYKMLEVPKNYKWDQRWRVVIFDIPETQRVARDQIRRALKSQGFQKLQLSVWIHPLPCLEQFEELREAYGLKTHLHLLTASLEVPSSISNYFARRYPALHL